MYNALLSRRQALWHSCLDDAHDACEQALVRDQPVAQPHLYLQGKQYLGLLQPVIIGQVHLDGTVREGTVVWNEHWNQLGTFNWQSTV